KGKGSTFTLQLRAPRAAIPATEDIAVDGAPVKSRPLSILLAEDDPINQQLTKAFLASSHCLLDIVPNGAAAVDAVRNHDFDLILLDCQMPVMDGYAATAQIRQLSGPRTPIVAITASALEQDKQRCLQADMDDVLTKPFSKRELLRLIERWTATPATD
ncbi:MAG TPA: hybrid sensor histidine kinase/response regulator, partial [Pseudohongiella sp.]|nr:hybrid sensor histidine kinase/response regulator [Pseudohongiella sp.]